MIKLELAGIEVDGSFFQDVEAAHQSLEQKLNAISDRATMAVGADVLATLKRVGQALAKKHNSPWNGRLVNDKSTLQKRSGGGIRSILDSIKTTENNINVVAAEITTGVMGIHETGGTKTPKRGKYLTIPLPAAMDSRGVPLRKRARDWYNTYVARSKRGSLIIFRKDGKEITPLYLLKTSVYIPPRLAMSDTIDDTLPYFERKAFESLARILETS